MNELSAWDAYWRDARGGACQTDDSGLYQGVIARQWRRRFAAVAPGSRILDLATGNGAVLELAQASLAETQLPVDLYGVDSARIQPRIGDEPRPGLRCHWYPEVAIEALPFDADTFDGVTSQYGVEYGDLEAVAAETARVLRPGGWLHWICHWRDGDLAADAAREVAQAEALQALDLPGRVAELARTQVRDGRWLTDSHRKTAGLPVAERMRAGLGEAFAITGTRPGQEGGNLSLFLHNLAHLYQHRESHPVETLLAKLDECGRELDYHRRRLAELVDAALTEESLAGLKRALARAGLELEHHGPLAEPATGRVVGYRIEALKPRPGSRPARRDTAAGARRDSDWHWSAYWRQGSLTTFDQGHFQHGYDGPVAAFWNQALDPLPDQAVIVDLATGNGALPLLMVRRARELGRRWRILGVDYAAIRIPDSGDDLERIRADLAQVELKSHTPMERTGLPDRSVDLVSSHFGIEYGDVPRAVAEAARILKRPGRLALVMHHPDSAVVEQARENLRQARLCVDEEKLDRKLAELVRAQAASSASGATDAGLQEREQAVRRTLERLGGQSDGRPGQLGSIVENYLRVVDDFRDRSRAERLAFIEQSSEALTAYTARLEAMLAAAMDGSRFSDFVARLEAAGFSAVRTGALEHDNGVLIGRTLTARLE